MKVNYNGKVYASAREFCEAEGLSYYSLMAYRHDNGVSIEEAIAHFIGKPRRESKSWTKNDIEKLHQMAADGYTRKQIAEALGRTPNTINKYCNKYGIHTLGRVAKIDEENKKRILAAENSGLEELAEVFDCTITTVYAHNKKLGGYKEKIAHEDEIRELAGKYRAEDIAEKLGLSVNTVRNIAWKCNISLSIISGSSNGRRKWTDAEITYLKEHRHDTPIKELCKNLERGKRVVEQKCRQLGI